MKLFSSFLISIFFVAHSLCFSQKVELQGRKKSLGLCISNYLFVTVPHSRASSISLTTNNGEIDGGYYDDKNGRAIYMIQPGTAGPATIYVWEKTGKGRSKLLDSATFNVVRRGYGDAGFWVPSGKLEQYQLRLSSHLDGPTDDAWSEHHRKLYSFTVIVYRDEKEVFKRRNEMDGLFDSATIDFFRYEISDGDKLVFTDVKMKDCDHQVINLGSLEYTISGPHLLRPPRLAVPDTQVFVDPVTGDEVKKIKWYRD